MHCNERSTFNRPQKNQSWGFEARLARWDRVIREKPVAGAAAPKQKRLTCLSRLFFFELTVARLHYELDRTRARTEANVSEDTFWLAAEAVVALCLLKAGQISSLILSTGRLQHPNRQTDRCLRLDPFCFSMLIA